LQAAGPTLLLSTTPLSSALSSFCLSGSRSQTGLDGWLVPTCKNTVTVVVR